MNCRIEYESLKRRPRRSMRLVVPVVLSISLAASAAVQPEIAPTYLDRELIAAIEANNVVAAERLLAAGASPDASNGRPRDGHSLCAATEPGREMVLELLVNRDADIDRLYGDNHFYGSPLTCAISRKNFVAFEMLLDAGASPDLDVCLFCEHRMNNGPFETALDNSEHRMAWRLVELGAVGPRSREALVHSLERLRPFEAELADPYRQKLIQWLREQGIAVRPFEERAAERKQLPGSSPPWADAR